MPSRSSLAGLFAACIGGKHNACLPLRYRAGVECVVLAPQATVAVSPLRVAVAPQASGNAIGPCRDNRHLQGAVPLRLV